MTDVILAFLKLKLVLRQYTTRPKLPAVQNQKAVSAHLYSKQICLLILHFRIGLYRDI